MFVLCISAARICGTRYILQLHAKCDFIMENYDLRKAARENELTSLANAKATLSGADFS